MIKAAVARAPTCQRGALPAIAERMQSLDAAAQVALLLAEDTAAAMHALDDRPFAAEHAPAVRLDADRPQAGFASWYEMFPRSATDDPARHGTFTDVIARLPAIRSMGFDVLYFPPIHPIGTTNRKGRNNALRAEPDDVGSPYAIGGPEGGYDAVHPQLGTLEDFRALVAAAKDNGLEIAIDFAVQCSPDHPWLREHPDWFRWRPDGSLRYAENPPKKYEDIVNPDFYADAAMPALWFALRDAVQFWVDQGVRIFRVDNPHTKPLPFWHWMIADIRGRHPEVIFLAEAFTRPKLMYRLAKVGFSQSYTYFTWRNTKQEIIEYVTELNAPPVRDFFRPNFFVNTPDINPPFLQTSGRPGFLIRAALACTLSGLWGMYSGFEICEAAPLPGREEYLDSEKYQIRVRDFAAPGNIVAEISALNRIRRAHAALQTHLGVTFYPAFNDQVLLYGKRTPGDRDMILVAVSLDPHGVQETAIEIPLWEWGLPDDAVAGGNRPDARPPLRLDRQAPASSASIPPICRSRSGRSHRREHHDGRRLRCRCRHDPGRAEREHAVVQGRDHLPAACQVVLRCQQRRHRRFYRPDLQARLHRRSRREHDLAAAVLSLATPRRRLRHRRLSRRASRLRHAGRRQALHRRGACARHAGDHRAGGQPHLRPASVVPARAAGEGRLGVSRLLCLVERRPQIRRHARHLRRHAAVQLDLGRGGWRLLLASILFASAGSEFRQSARAEGGAGGPALLARSRCRWAAARRGARTWWNARAPTTRTCRKPTRC